MRPTQQPWLQLAGSLAAGAVLIAVLASSTYFVAAQGKKDTKKETPKETKKEEPKKEIPKDKTPPLATLKGHTDWINSLAYSSDGKFLVTASRDKTVKVWDLASGKDVNTFKDHPTNVKSAIFSPDGKQVLATTGAWSKDKKQWIGEVRIWDIAGNKIAKTLAGHSETILDITLSSDGKYLASASEDKTAIVWDIALGKELQTLKGHTDKVSSVAFTKDGSKVATGSYDKTIKIFETATGKDTLTIKGPEREVTCVAFTPDGTKIAAGSTDNTVRIFDLTGKELQKIAAPEGLWSLSFSGDGKALAVSGWNDTIKVYSATDGKELFQRNGHERTVSAVSFSPDGQTLATAGIDGTIKTWAMPK